MRKRQKLTKSLLANWNCTTLPIEITNLHRRSMKFRMFSRGLRLKIHSKSYHRSQNRWNQKVFWTKSGRKIDFVRNWFWIWFLIFGCLLNGLYLLKMFFCRNMCASDFVRIQIVYYFFYVLCLWMERKVKIIFLEMKLPVCTCVRWKRVWIYFCWHFYFIFSNVEKFVNFLYLKLFLLNMPKT